MSNSGKEPDISNAYESKIWRCGDPYRYNIPKPKGNPEDVVLSALLLKDKAQCDAWKDEVQNLLIFAGLFSAVVTGFVVESSRDLQTDSGDATVMLLLRIAESLDGSLNSTDLFTPDVRYSPSLTASPSSIRVNIFWFFSLILSIATSIIAIVSLQWIREHQHYPARLSPEQALGIYHLRKEALEKWHVPAIFTSLPLLLQAALVIFLVGVIDFLHARNSMVAIPVTVLISFTFLFFIITTVLPTFHNHFAFANFWKPRPEDGLPVPCPYKSPQSLAFGTLARKVKVLTKIFYPGIVSLPRIVLARFGLVVSRSPNRKQEYFSRDWVDLDIGWLSLRDSWSESFAERAWMGQSQVFDTAHALIVACSEHAGNTSVLYAAYHCFRDACWPSPRVQPTLRYYLTASHHTFRSVSTSVSATGADEFGSFIDGKAHVFLDLLSNNQTHVLTRHKWELVIRLLANFFAGRPRLAIPHDRYQLLNPHILEGILKRLESKLVEAVPDDITDEICNQIIMIGRSFFQAVYDADDKNELAVSHDKLGLLFSFMRCVATATLMQGSYEFNVESNCPSFFTSLDLIASAFGGDPTRTQPRTLDYLFYSSGIYITYLAAFARRRQPKRCCSLPDRIRLTAMNLRRYALGIDVTRFTLLYGDLSKLDNWPSQYKPTDNGSKEMMACIFDFSESDRGIPTASVPSMTADEIA